MGTAFDRFGVLKNMKYDVLTQKEGEGRYSLIA